MASRYGFILDEDLVNRVDYTGVEDTRILNLKDPGIRDTDARVLTEHMRSIFLTRIATFVYLLESPN